MRNVASVFWVMLFVDLSFIDMTIAKRLAPKSTNPNHRHPQKKSTCLVAVSTRQNSNNKKDVHLLC